MARYQELPYKKVLDSNGLNFSNNPEHKLISQLTRYNIPKAKSIVDKVKSFKDNNKLTEFIDIIMLLAEPADQLILLTARGWISGEQQSVEEIRSEIAPEPRPIVQCYQTTELDELIEYATQQNLVLVEKRLNGYGVDPIPNFDQFLNPVVLVEYFSTSDFYLAIKSLFFGELYQFFFELIRLHVNIDVTTNYNERQLFINLINAAYNIVTPGYE